MTVLVSATFLRTVPSLKLTVGAGLLVTLTSEPDGIDAITLPARSAILVAAPGGWV